MAATKRRRRRSTSRRTRPATRRRRRNYAVTPRRRTRRAANPAPRRRRRRNSTRITIRRNRRRTTARRRNPQLFGSSVSTGKMIEAVLGGLVGVTAAKMIPAALPTNMTSTPVMRVVSSVASAWIAGWAAGRVSRPFGDAVLFGGLMQAGSLALNAFIPSIGAQIGLSGGVRGGLGELVAGAFPVPQNPLNPMQANYPAYGRPMIDAPYGNGAPVTMSGLSRAFGRAF